jgi:predicted GNAT family acetyltransferase
MDATVRNAVGRSRYELVVQGRVLAILEYRVNGDIVVLPHTEVMRNLRGRGLAETLVQGALDDLRSQGKRIVPACWFVREFIDDHEDYADLVA